VSTIYYTDRVTVTNGSTKPRSWTVAPGGEGMLRDLVIAAWDDEPLGVDDTGAKSTEEEHPIDCTDLLVVTTLKVANRSLIIENPGQSSPGCSASIWHSRVSRPDLDTVLRVGDKIEITLVSISAARPVAASIAFTVERQEGRR
jgi:hypothetical protein